MQFNNQIVRCSTSMLLVVALFLTGLFSYPFIGFAAVQEVTVTRYKLDTGIIFIWCNSAGEWQRGISPGSVVPLSASTTIGANAQNIKIVPYTMDNFPFDDPDSIWYETAKAWDKKSYDQNYYRKSANVNTVSITNYNPSTGSLTFSTNNLLMPKDGKPYNVVETLMSKGKQEILDLVGESGGKDLENFMNESNFAGSVKGQLYFVPTVISWQETILQEVPEPGIPVALEATLGLPSTGVINEPYPVEDKTILPAGAEFSSSTMERNDGTGWRPVTSWKGKALGESLQETASEEGSIQYRLTVNLKSGESDTDEKTINISDGTVVDAECHLALPAWTYEGHPVTATDQSTYQVNGESYSALRAYEEDKGTNRFTIMESGAGTINKDKVTPIYATAVFPKKGNYNVQLKITPQNSSGSLYDTKPIEVRKTPTVMAQLGGVQKQNRKQTLDITVATSPDHPLTDLYATLTNLDTGESVTLDHKLGKGSNTLENSENIKTRAIEDTGSDPYFTLCSLPFLTKDRAVTNYQYKVYAKDSSGNWDSVEKEFVVQPDLPPVAKISVQDRFFREKASNTATIEMEDVSGSDGDDLQRSWFVTEDRNADDDFSGEPEEIAENRAGFQDNAFGTKKIIAMSKTGVGKVKIRLHVKDVWTEETLPEYITEDDYLSAETTAETMVDNIAPVVSLKPISSKTANILLLAAGEQEYNTLKQTTNAMEGILLGHAIDADLSVEQLDKPLDGRVSPLYYFYKGQPYGYGGDSSSFEDESYLIDDKKLYTVEATWQTGANYWNSTPVPPYTIRAFDHESDNGEKEVWTYRIQPSSGIPLSSSFYLAQDDSNQYLYYVSGGKTALFTKDNGTLLTILPFEVGRDTYINGDSIYTFKDNGVYRINRKSGEVKQIFTASMPSVAKKIDGNVHFFLSSGLKIRRVILDLKTEEFSYEALPDTLSPGYRCIGIDSQGTMILHGNDEVRVYGRSNNGLYSAGVSGAGNIRPVYDRQGICHTIAYATRNSSSNYKHVYAHILDIRNRAHLSYDNRSKGGYLTKNQVILAGEMPDGKVYFSTGANYVDTDNGYGVYSERAITYCYDPSAGTLEKVATGYYGGISSTMEYGMDSDLFAAAHVGDNNKNVAVAESGTTVIKKPQTMGDIFQRYLKKNLQHTNQMQIVGLYSNQQQSMSAADLSSVAAKLSQSGTQFFFLTKEAKNAGYGQQLAERIGGSILYTETPAQALAEALVAGSNQEQVLKLTAGTQAGSIKKTVALQGNKKYFYEYDVKEARKEGEQSTPLVKKDLFQSNLSISPMVSESLLGTSRYYVADYVYETFSAGTDINPALKTNAGVFSTSGGKHGNAGSGFSQGDADDYDGMFGCYIRIGSSKYSGSWPHQEKLSFEVPPGQRALLSFDYSAQCNNRRDVEGCIFNVCGNVFKPFSGQTTGSFEEDGTYTYPGFLYPGEQTITLDYGFSGKWGDARTLIDNLKITFIQDTSSSTEPWQPVSSIRPQGDGWSTVQGTFQTPGSIAYYQNLTSGNGSSYANSFLQGGSWYVPAARFNNLGTFTFALEQGDQYLLRGLKVYYIENGKRVYAADETFNRPESLSSWSNSGVTASLVSSKKEEDEEDSLIYKKGELVRYGINYYDYEEDPSKMGYWRYLHTPFNDGPHPDAAAILDEDGLVVSYDNSKILTAPIDRFYVDGKYTVEHWEYDDTSRKTKPEGNPLYDKKSNVESLTFYVEGGASAPWITSIQTVPATVKEGKPFQIEVGIDDAEKDVLNLTTEVYKEKKLIYTHQRKGITANAAGIYPTTTTGTVMAKAQMGKYEVVCTVRDQTGAGLGSYRFYVVSEGKITGKVNHTDQWDQNRKKYNLKRFNDEIQKVIPYAEYIKQKEPRKRGTNVFWSGEKFLLEAAVAGSPIKVTCKIDGTSYTTTMKSTGKKNKDDEMIYDGVLWKEDMINKWGRKTPKELTFTFTATYEGDTVKTDKAVVIVDSKEDYWLLHRLF